MAQRHENSQPTPDELTQVLRTLCQWRVVERVIAEARQSEQAPKSHIGYLELGGEAWHVSSMGGTGGDFKSVAAVFKPAGKTSASERSLRFRAYSYKVPIARVRPNDPVIQTSPSFNIRTQRHEQMATIDVAPLLTAPTSWRTRPNQVAVRMQYSDTLRKGDLEFARLDFATPPIENTDFEVGHTRLLNVGQALLSRFAIMQRPTPES